MAELTYEAAIQIAEFIHAYVRPEWDVKGIVHALKEAREGRAPAAVAVAALLAAQNAANRTPAVIPLGGPHWAATGATSPRRSAPPRNKTCATCYLAEDECRRRWHWDHKFESVQAARDRAISEADGVPTYVRRRHEYQQGTYHDGRPVNTVELP